jgi:hypothetical protein
MPYVYQTDEYGNGDYVWVDDDVDSWDGDAEPPSLVITDPGVAGPGGEDLTNPIGDPGVVGPGGEDLTRPIVADPGTVGPGGEDLTGPGRDVNTVGPGGEDLESESSKVVQKDGKYYDSTGRLLYDPKGNDASGIMGLLTKAVGKDTAAKIKKLFIDDKGNVNAGVLAGIGAGIYGLTGGNTPTTGGYKGTIPKYEAVRQKISQPEYTPYSGQPAMGRRYFSDIGYATKGNTEEVATAKENAAKQVAELEKYVPKIAKAKEAETAKATTTGIANLPAVPSAMEIAKQTYPDKSKSTAGTGTASGIASALGDSENYKDKANADAYNSRMADPEYKRLSDAAAASRGGRLTMEVTPEEQTLNRYGGATKDDRSTLMADMENAAKLAQAAQADAPITLAKGGPAMKQPRYLRGKTDGMADKIRSSIDDKQPAKLSHGEFVIPADVVSHLGNGNSDAGADVLYKMMDRVRKARTGTKKQGKQINAAKFTPGGIAGYKSGGAVAFQTGGTTGVVSPTTAATTEESLAPWVGDYVTDYLGRGKALAAQPYQAYEGPLTAGASPVQTQAFTKAQGLGGTFDAAAANQYMNPYIQSALQPQLNEMRRQADISQQGLSGKFAQAGSLGGARDAIARSEGIRNLLNQQSGVIGSAYQNAYDKAMGQYNTSRQQDIADVNAMLTAGNTQRGIEQEGITANKAAFEAEREDPYQKLNFEKSLLGGLPLSTKTTVPNLTPMQQLGLTGDQMTKFYDMITNWLNPAETKATTTTGTTATTGSSGTTKPG